MLHLVSCIRYDSFHWNINHSGLFFLPACYDLIKQDLDLDLYAHCGSSGENPSKSDAVRF